MRAYLWGGLLGVSVTLAFLLTGHGITASGAYSTVTNYLVSVLAPDHYAEHEGFYLLCLDQCIPGNSAAHPLLDWGVFEVAGIALGAFASALLFRRAAFPSGAFLKISPGGRPVVTFFSGVIAAWGAQLGHGCTSSQVLSGGALLQVGSWIFMGAVFLGGFLGAAATALSPRRGGHG